MKKRSLTCAFSAAVATVLISSGLLVGAAASADAEPAPPEDKDIVGCLLGLKLAECLTEESDLLGTGVVGEPLTLVEPVFGLLGDDLLGLLDTDISWLCNGNPIPGTQGLTEFVPTEALEGCQVAVETVTTLLGFVPLTLVTDLIGITGDGEEPELPGSLLEVLTANPILSGTGNIGDPLTVTKPVFGLLDPALQLLLQTDVTWLCDGVAIPDAEGLAFVPTAAQAGCEITAEVVTTLLALTLDLLTNVIDVDEEAPETLVAQVLPTISGAKKVGGILSIDPGTWLGGSDLVTPLFEYQWYNAAGAIPGATAREYVPRLADAGKPLAATVTAKLTGFLQGLGITNKVKVGKVGSKTKLRKLDGRVVLFKVSPGAAHPTGKVRLMKGGKLLKAYKLRLADNGRRTVRLPKLGKGVHQVRAVYLGNKALKRSASKTVRVVLR
ncbi:MAG TPA: hypothetical protein VFO49_12235 [Nocardioides sp.]|nr:hypothetical protein [Nocardioides sp.]